MRVENRAVLSVQQAATLFVDDKLSAYFDTSVYKDLAGVILADRITSFGLAEQVLTLGKYLVVGESASYRFVSIGEEHAVPGTVLRPEKFSAPMEASVLTSTLLSLVSQNS